MSWSVSWRRRYSSYVACYFGKSVPILVYQMGKVGSPSTSNTLLLRGLHPVLHLHTFSPLREKRPEDVVVEDDLREAVVREPIAANVSMCFQLIPWHTQGRYRPDRISTGELIRLFFEHYCCDRPLIWFDEEMKYATGVDVYQHPFPKDEGSLSFRSGNVDVLVLKTETDDAVKEKALARFLGIEGVRLSTSNVGAERERFSLQWYRSHQPPAPVR